ncbi:hypothetical protein Aperf_G00000107009 [Anoplocephala perfoliata]
MTVDVASLKTADEISESLAQSWKGYRMQSRQIQTEELREDEEACKENISSLSPNLTFPQKQAFSCPHKCLSSLTPPREFAFKQNRSGERSIDNTGYPIQPPEKDGSKLSFLPTFVPRIASVFNSRKKGEDEVARRVAAALKDPSKIANFSQPGYVIESPPIIQYNVPLILDALLTALELHRLHHVGLYRVPGRQREIHQCPK